MASLKEHGDVHVAARLPWESTRLVLSVLQLHNVTSDVGDLLFQIFHLPSKAVCEGAHGGSLLRYVRRLGRGFANKFLGRIWLMSEVKALSASELLAPDSFTMVFLAFGPLLSSFSTSRWPHEVGM